MNKVFTENNKNKNHPQMFLSGLYTLEKTKAVETPDYRFRGWTGVRGFTLIELLVVVLIIGILSAVALPQYQKAVRKARIAEQIAVLRSLYPMVESCFLEKGTTGNCNFSNLGIDVPACKSVLNPSASCSYEAGITNGSDSKHYAYVKMVDSTTEEPFSIRKSHSEIACEAAGGPTSCTKLVGFNKTCTTEPFLIYPDEYICL